MMETADSSTTLLPFYQITCITSKKTQITINSFVGICKCLAIWQKVHVQLARFFATKELNCKILWNVNFGGSE